MKLSTSTIWQLVAWLTAAASQYGALVPARYQPYVTAVSGVAAILLHLHAGNRDQAGNKLPPVK